MEESLVSEVPNPLLPLAEERKAIYFQEKYEKEQIEHAKTAEKLKELDSLPNLRNEITELKAEIDQLNQRPNLTETDYQTLINQKEQALLDLAEVERERDNQNHQ